MNRPRTIGLILAGGRSRRMDGQDKALIRLRGETLLAHSIRRLRPQVDAVALNSNARAEDFAAFGLPVIADTIAGYHGPLAGIHAGLLHFPDDYLVTVAVDLPFLPADLVTRLRAGLGAAGCAFASDATQHALALLWRPGTAAEVESFLARGARSLREFLATHGSPVVFNRPRDRGLFLNLNTPEDLARAEQEAELADL